MTFTGVGHLAADDGGKPHLVADHPRRFGWTVGWSDGAGRAGALRRGGRHRRDVAEPDQMAISELARITAPVPAMILEFLADPRPERMLPLGSLSGQ